MNKVGLGLTHPQKVSFLEMVAACYPNEKSDPVIRFNVNDRLQIGHFNEDNHSLDQDEIWDWFEFAVIMIPDLISTTNHQAFVHRMNMMELIAPYKEYSGAPKFTHPVDYLYPEFIKWKQEQDKKKK